jgi:hypothetical protein
LQEKTKISGSPVVGARRKRLPIIEQMFDVAISRGNFPAPVLQAGFPSCDYGNFVDKWGLGT